jgi:hypothetical protein
VTVRPARRRKRTLVVLLLLVLLLLVAGVVGFRWWHDRGDTAADTGESAPAGTVVPGGTVEDGATVTGKVGKPGQRNTYDIVLADVQFSLVDVTGDVDVRVLDPGDAPPRMLPGPYQYAVAKPGRYRLDVTLKDGATGSYGFRVVTRKPRRFEVAAGELVGAGGVAGTGRLDVPGRVDVYVVDRPAAARIELAGGEPCSDVNVGFTHAPDAPTVATPHLVCWDPTSPEIEGQLAVVVWSEAGRTGDYTFRIDPAA